MSRPTHAPLPSTPPIYGTATQLVSVDTSPSLPAPQTKYIQEVIGVFLWYARTIDHTMLCPLSELSSRQSTPTQDLLQDGHHFLQYAASHPNAQKRILPSDMRLIISSYAS